MLIILSDVDVLQLLRFVVSRPTPLIFYANMNRVVTVERDVGCVASNCSEVEEFQISLVYDVDRFYNGNEMTIESQVILTSAEDIR